MSSSVIENGVKSDYQNHFKEHIDRQKCAVDLQNSIGQLLYEKGIELVLFRNPLVDVSRSELLQLHDYAKEVVEKPITVYHTSSLAREIMNLDLAPSKLDIGRLAFEWHTEQSNYANAAEFLSNKLVEFRVDSQEEIKPKDVVLFGFGRIGRLAARELIKQAGKGQQLRLRAIVVRRLDEAQLKKRAYLLRNDSVHGPFAGSIIEDYENMSLIINGQRVKFIAASNPEDINYTEYGINNALIVDNTGVFKDKEALSRHLKSNGATRVLLTAPGKEIPNIVYGVNNKTLELEEDRIISAASCTTNAIVPVLKIIHDNLGVEKGHIETVHAYTNDQNLLDNFHKKERRGRSAAINMVITETGAGKAVTKVIPDLDQKLTANAVRVPVPNGSLAILSLNVSKETSLEEVNSLLKEAALKGDLVNQINYNINEECVSSDIVGNTCCSVYDSNATIVHPDKRNIVLYVWYDNEFGYTKQVIRLAKYVAKVRRLQYY
ncbi:MAG: glyceraldehyde-3-phosphate dehydrogenase [Flavobacteriales bacterium]|nr:glyceraldehyde-3-phosphate dehydrogenase [Flavobacteriales bacterium]